MLGRGNQAFFQLAFDLVLGMFSFIIDGLFCLFFSGMEILWRTIFGDSHRYTNHASESTQTKAQRQATSGVSEVAEKARVE